MIVKLDEDGHEIDDWILNSGCNEHMVQDHRTLMDYRKTSSWSVNSSRKGVKITVEGIGKINLPVESVHIEFLPLNNVLHVPDIGKNLLSVRQLEKERKKGGIPRWMWKSIFRSSSFDQFIGWCR
jgi:hypothetical protein